MIGRISVDVEASPGRAAASRDAVMRRLLARSTAQERGGL